MAPDGRGSSAGSTASSRKRPRDESAGAAAPSARRRLLDASRMPPPAPSPTRVGYGGDGGAGRAAADPSPGIRREQNPQQAPPRNPRERSRKGRILIPGAAQPQPPQGRRADSLGTNSRAGSTGRPRPVTSLQPSPARRAPSSRANSLVGGMPPEGFMDDDLVSMADTFDAGCTNAHFADPFKMKFDAGGWEEESLLDGTMDGLSQIDPHEGAVAAGGLGDIFPHGEETRIGWSTVVMSEYRAKIEAFLETWVAAEEEDGGMGVLPASLSAGALGTISKYQQEFLKVFRNGRSEMSVDLRDLKEFHHDTFRDTVRYPVEALPILSEQANKSFVKTIQIFERDHDSELPEIRVTVCNMPSTTALRDLKPEDMGQIVAVEGMVVRLSKLLPEMRSACFECNDCFHREFVQEERGKIDEPERCTECGKRLAFELKHLQCDFVDKQFLRMQETPSATPEGETPASVSITLYGALVDCVLPGDRVVVTGIYKATAVRVNSNSQICKGVFKTFIEATHVQRTTKAKDESKKAAPTLFEDDGDNGLDMQDPATVALLDSIVSTSKHPDLYNILIRSLAPSIYGHEDVKLGVLCQLFGGTRKSFTYFHARPEIHVLLCGDPGVAKSQVLSHVNTIAPRGIYTSGKGSSSVGLTAFLVRDAETGEFVLESGALVLSDRGICCIDEFDKMDDSTRSVLHEVMEQQTVSIAKAGIICTLNARASILAAANPIDSTWNRDFNILKNLNISATLLSRFDLIYLVLDEKNANLDQKLAMHVCEMFTKSGLRTRMGSKFEAALRGGATQATQPATQAPTPVPVPPTTQPTAGGAQPLYEGPPGREYLNKESLSKYLAYAKAKVFPRLSKDACEALTDAYVQMRNSRGGRNVVTATTRQLEAMVRLSEAYAKMRLSDTVDVMDVRQARTLIESALKESCIDKATGMLISAGGDTHTNVSAKKIYDSVVELIKRQGWMNKAISNVEIQQALNDKLNNPISTADLAEVLPMLKERGHGYPQGAEFVFGKLPGRGGDTPQRAGATPKR